MTIADELSKLADLKDKGVLNAEEFEQAKRKILSGDAPPKQNSAQRSQNRVEFRDSSQNSFGKAANRYVSFQILMGVIGLILFVIIGLPMMCSMRSNFNKAPSFQSLPGFSP